MAKLRLYLDTSVLSAIDDDTHPERRSLSVSFWQNRSSFDISVSELTKRELNQTPDCAKRKRLLGLLDELTIHALTSEMHGLAGQYVDARVFKPRDYNDALHLATAVLLRQDVLVSWNFRHLVNRRIRAQVDHLNATFNLPFIEILAPPEV